MSKTEYLVDLLIFACISFIVVFIVMLLFNTDKWMQKKPERVYLYSLEDNDFNKYPIWEGVEIEDVNSY